MVISPRYILEQSALALLENIAETDNQDLDMLKMECYCSLNQYPKVLEITEELITRDCDYLEEVFEYISPILNDLDMNKEARDFVDRGLALFPDNLILKNELCYILETEGDVPRAIELCNELIDKNPFIRVLVYVGKATFHGWRLRESDRGFRLRLDV